MNATTPYSLSVQAILVGPMTDIGHNGGPPLIRGGDGWVAIHRSMRDHWLVGFGQPVKPLDPEKGSLSRAEAWIDLIMECRYEAGSVNNGGHKMHLEPGQLVGAVSWLAARWNWTPKTVRGFLDKLENDGMIALYQPGVKEGEQKGKQSSVVTVCNYSQYQIVADDKGQAIGHAEGKQGASKGQAEGNNTKDNKGTKEQRNKEEDSPQTPVGGSEPASDDPPKLTFRAVAREAFSEWQDFAREHGLSVPRDSTFDTFAAQILARMREHASAQTRTAMLEVWRSAICYVAKSKFLRGLAGGDFKADLAMITRPKNFAKLISGGYGNGAAPLDDRWRMVPAPGDAAPHARPDAIDLILAAGRPNFGGDR